MRARGLGDPILVASDGAPGIIRAIEECFPRSARQRCLAHRMRYLAVTVPADQWPEFKARVTACYQAPSRTIARDLRAGIIADYADSLRCFDDDFEACYRASAPAGYPSSLDPHDESDRAFVRRGTPAAEDRA
jgi:putative transposase